MGISVKGLQQRVQADRPSCEEFTGAPDIKNIRITYIHGSNT